MIEERGARAKVVSVVLTVIVAGLLFLTGPAGAFSLNLSSSVSSVNIGEEISFTASLDIEAGERLPVEYLEIEVGGVVCRFESNGDIISGCNNLSIVRIENASFTEGNRTGNFLMQLDSEWVI